MTAFYNEIDPYAAQWLRNLIAAGHIAPGIVDERSIVDIRPDDLAGFTQVHFFAGIGGWSLAARLAGWPDDRPLWTGSCPCQPFSVAGAGKGQADARHLWPEFHRIIAACRPDVVMGEQVAAAVGKSWLDGVCSDLESIGYACGAAVVPACAVDAPHRRDRLWFVADRDSGMHNGPWRLGTSRRLEYSNCGTLADDGAGRRAGPLGWECEQPWRAETIGAGDSNDRALANGNEFSASQGRQQRSGQFRGAGGDSQSCAMGNGKGLEIGSGSADERGVVRSKRPTPSASGIRSAWGEAAWIIGADGKARRVKPGVRLLAHGVPARVGKLRAFGNAIVPQVAAEIIGAYMDASAAPV